MSKSPILLYPKQIQFLDCDVPFAAFVGGIASGKSYVLCYNRLKRLRRNKTYMMVAPTYKMLQDSTLRSLMDLIRQLEIPHDFKGQKMQILFPRTNSEILLRSATDPESLRGPNLFGVDLDEASLMAKTVYDICIGRLRQDPIEVGELRAAFTPKGPTHWTHEVFAMGKPDTAIFRARTDENPFLPEHFFTKISGQYGETQFARQELGGEFVQLEGAEFPAEWFDWEGFWFDEWPDTWRAKVIALDPSKGRDVGTPKPGRDPDYQAYVLALLGEDNTIYLDAVLNREPITEMIKRGIQLCKAWGPVDSLILEDNGTMGFMTPEVTRQTQEAGILIPWQTYTQREPKLFRIRGLGGYLSRQQIRIKNTPGGRLLRGQLGDVPLGEYDDGPDAAALAVRRLELLTA